MSFQQTEGGKDTFSGSTRNSQLQTKLATIQPPSLEPEAPTEEESSTLAMTAIMKANTVLSMFYSEAAIVSVMPEPVVVSIVDANGGV
jgi:hypothetical protein